MIHRPGTRKPILLLAHLDVVEARREDWSFDPFKFLESASGFIRDISWRVVLARH